MKRKYFNLAIIITNEGICYSLWPSFKSGNTFTYFVLNINLQRNFLKSQKKLKIWCGHYASLWNDNILMLHYILQSLWYILPMINVWIRINILICHLIVSFEEFLNNILSSPLEESIWLLSFIMKWQYFNTALLIIIRGKYFIKDIWSTHLNVHEVFVIYYEMTIFWYSTIV